MKLAKLTLSLILAIVFIAAGSIPMDGLITWYPFNGNASDSVGPNDIHDPSDISRYVDSWEGESQKAAQFADGLSSYDLIGFPMGSEPRTAAMWIKPSGYRGSDTAKSGIFRWGGQTSNQFSDDAHSFGIHFHQENILGAEPYLYITGFDQTIEHSGTIMPEYLYTHAALTYADGTLKFYINGSLYSTHSVTGLNSTEPDLVLGGAINFDDRSVVMDEFMVYNRELSADEITHIYTRIPPSSGNNSPVFTSNPITSVYSGSTYSYTTIANDADGDAITYSLQTAPTSMDISGNIISWATNSTDVGLHQVIIVATDTPGDTAQQVFNVSVSTQTGNNPPAILTIPVTTVSIDVTQYLYDVNAADADGDNLTYTLTVKPTGMDISEGDGLIFWASINMIEGAHSVTVVVSDGNGGTDEQSYTLTVTGTQINTPPEFVSTPVTNTQVGNSYSYTIETDDANGDAVTLTLHTSPTGMGLSGNTLTWIPTSVAIGTHSIILVARDPNGGMTLQTFNVTVEPRVSITNQIKKVNPINKNKSHTYFNIMGRKGISGTRGISVRKGVKILIVK